MKFHLLILATITVLAMGASHAAGEAPGGAAPQAAAPDACPLPHEYQQSLTSCASMQWRHPKGDGSFATTPIAADDAAVVKDLLLYKTQAARTRNPKAPNGRYEERLRLQLLDATGKNICSIPMCYIAPESDARGGVFGYSRYSMSNEDYTTLFRIMLRPEVVAEVPQGKAPERQELIRRYNCGNDRYNAQTHVMTYRLVSGKEILACRPQGSPPLPGEPVIDPARTYGVASIIKPRNEPILGGGDLEVIYDPETGAILSGGKAR